MLVDDEDSTFARIVWKICHKRKRQPWIVAVYRSLERQIYFNCWKEIQCEDQAVQCRFWSLQRKIYAKIRKNQQREVPAVLGAINKIAVVKSSMECHLPLCWFITKMKFLHKFFVAMTKTYTVPLDPHIVFLFNN